MNLESLNETHWRSIKFFLLFVLVFCIQYVILTKIIIKVPIVDNQKLLATIMEFENIIDQEKRIVADAKLISDEIKIMEFDVYQIQKQDEIKRFIYKIEFLYKENNRLSKYKFSLQMSRLLDIYYYSREKNGNLSNNINLLSKNLTECQANI